jgi:hypothetical protein
MMNGSTNWISTRPIVTYRQPPCMRARYQEISSGRLPDHVIRNCEKLK